MDFADLSSQKPFSGIAWNTGLVRTVGTSLCEDSDTSASYPEEEGESVRLSAQRTLNEDETRLHLGDLAFRFEVDTELDQVYELTWIEHFVPDAVTNPNGTPEVLDAKTIKFKGAGGAVYLGEFNHENEPVGAQYPVMTGPDAGDDFILDPPTDTQGSGSTQIDVLLLHLTPTNLIVSVDQEGTQTIQPTFGSNWGQNHGGTLDWTVTPSGLGNTSTANNQFTFSASTSVPGTYTVRAESSLTPTVFDECEVIVLKAELESDKAANSPQAFTYGETSLDSPCGKELEDQKDTLVIYYNEVFNYQTEQVEDFDVTLKVSPTSVQGVIWSKEDGPTSGTLINASQAEATFQNPKEGGLYEFDMELNSVVTKTQLLLPVAGPDITTFWESEINYFRNTWGPAYRTKLDNETYGLRFRPIYRAIRKHGIALSEMRDVGINLDWVGEVTGTKTPCGGPAGLFSASGQEWRQTMYGIVIDFRKRNNMMYGLIGREMTLLKSELKNLPNILKAGTPDQDPTYVAYEAGFALHDGDSLQTVMDDYGYDMQIPDGWAQKEWPSLESSSGTLTRKAAQQLQEMIQ